MTGLETNPARSCTATKARRRFGLDTPLPADRRTIERALLRHLAENRPGVVPLPLGSAPPVTVGPACRAPVEAGLPDLLLLGPGGRLAFIKIKTQAEALSRPHRAFADLCRERAIPFAIVRSLPEAKRALDALGF